MLDQLIKLGATHKALRPHIRPLLAALSKEGGSDPSIIQQLQSLRRDMATALVNRYTFLDRVLTRGVQDVTYVGEDGGDHVYEYQIKLEGVGTAYLQLRFYADVHGIVHGETQVLIEGRVFAEEVFMVMNSFREMHEAVAKVVEAITGGRTSTKVAKVMTLMPAGKSREGFDRKNVTFNPPVEGIEHAILEVSPDQKAFLYPADSNWRKTGNSIWGPNYVHNLDAFAPGYRVHDRSGGRGF